MKQQKPLWFIAAGCYDIGDNNCPTPLHGALVRSVNADGAWRQFKRLCKKRGLAVWNVPYPPGELVPDGKGGLCNADDNAPFDTAKVLQIIGVDKMLAVCV